MLTFPTLEAPLQHPEAYSSASRVGCRRLPSAELSRAYQELSTRPGRGSRPLNMRSEAEAAERLPTWQSVEAPRSGHSVGHSSTYHPQDGTAPPDSTTNLTCEDDIRQDAVDGWEGTHNPPVAGSRPAGPTPVAVDPPGSGPPRFATVGTASRKVDRGRHDLMRGFAAIPTFSRTYTCQMRRISRYTLPCKGTAASPGWPSRFSTEEIVTDYRRHDAPPRDRPKEVLSPFLKLTQYFCWGICTVVAIFKGWAAAGSILGIFTLGFLSLSTDPKYDYFDRLDKRYSAWLTPRVRSTQKRRAQRKARAIARFEREGWIRRRTGHSLAWWLFLGWILLIPSGEAIERLTSFPYFSRVGCWVLFCWVAFLLLRYLQLIQLQGMADRPLGPVKYIYARDAAIFLETWRYRAVAQFLAVLFTGVCSAVAYF